MANKQNRYNSEQKLSIVKEHLIKRKEVSKICEEYGISPSLFYKWQQSLFENGAQCFEKTSAAKRSREAKKIQELERQLEQRDSKLIKKNEVVAELLEENIKLKKSSGEI